MLGKPLNIPPTPFIDRFIDAVSTFALVKVRARSSVVEHFVDIEGVTSSNLVVPTIPV